MRACAAVVATNVTRVPAGNSPIRGDSPGRGFRGNVLTGSFMPALNSESTSPKGREIAAFVVAHMKGREVEITVDIGLGKGRATAWTCDLTHGYIDINGSYRS